MNRDTRKVFASIFLILLMSGAFATAALPVFLKIGQGGGLSDRVEVVEGSECPTTIKTERRRQL